MTPENRERKVLFHISPNVYPPLPTPHHTKNIWLELAKGFDEYHVVARSEDNHSDVSYENNIVLHRLSRLTKKSRIFFFSSFYVLFLIKKFRGTHILCQCPLLGGFAAILAKKIWGVPVLIEIHGDVYFKYLTRGGWKYFLHNVILRFVFRNATKIRSLSTAMTASLNELGYSKNVVLIPNRVNTNLFDSPKANFKIGSPLTVVGIGRFVEQKGFDVAIEAIKLLKQILNIRLILVGGGFLRQKLEKLSKELPVELIDWVDQVELRDILKGADIYIQPSKPYLGEAMPRTILEAMAMRLPIISTEVGAIPGVLVDEHNSLLVEPNNSKQLAEAIVKLAGNEVLRTSIAHNAFVDVTTKFEWEKVFSTYRKQISDMA